mgnify:FL=1
MNNATMWLWWYGLLAGLPLVILGLLVRESIRQPAWQRVGMQRHKR